MRWLRPRPTRATGWALLFIASVLIVLNLIMEFTNEHLLPGDHTPLYLLGGAGIGLLGMFVRIGAGVMASRAAGWSSRPELPRRRFFALGLVAVAEGKQGRALAVVRTGTGAPPPRDAAPAELAGRLMTAGQLRAAEQVRLPRQEVGRTHVLNLGMSMGEYRWTINDQVFGEHDPLPVEQGERARLRFVNRTMMFHPMHLHGHTFQVATGSGAGPRKDTAIVLPMQAVEVDVQADNPGQWLVHCHNVYHQEAGMATVLSYVE